VEKLLPGQYVQFRDGRIEKGFYWHLDYRDRDDASFEAHASRFRDLLRKALVGIAKGEVLGAFLSGGTDSSTVCGVLTEVGGKPVDSYSIGYEVEEFDEMEYARIATKRFGCRPHEYYLKPDDILEAVPLIARSYDEPFANDSAVPVYFCAKRAAENGVMVMIAGDGGDEIFGGNARYAKQLAFELYGKAPSTLRKGLVEPLLFGIPGGDRIALLRKGKSYIRQANVPLPDRMESYNFLYRQPMQEVFEPDFLTQVDTAQPEAWLREVYFRTASEDPVNRMMHLDLKFTLADNDLRKVNRMCEEAGVQVRYPMLDERLVAFSGELPPQYKVRGRQLRWFFKEALKDFLPAEIIHKTKHGFGLPFGVWSLSHPPLRELVDASLTSIERRGILRPEYIRELRRQHADVHPTYFGKMVWVLLILEQWFQAHGFQ
jgi:asparagine synthase (glutamine-hydrolysing)